jgi:hypothetical protein
MDFTREELKDDRGLKTFSANFGSTCLHRAKETILQQRNRAAEAALCCCEDVGKSYAGEGLPGTIPGVLPGSGLSTC